MIKVYESFFFLILYVLLLEISYIMLLIIVFEHLYLRAIVTDFDEIIFCSPNYFDNE